MMVKKLFAIEVSAMLVAEAFVRMMVMLAVMLMVVKAVLIFAL